ncbi:PIG-L family deacetylase [Micromonospora sp. WMMD1082]|uniref:PIG-L deacetylase family protein n=1 Tax=Micromonospora sp. WMMD1082 TaxID=3016104 RepID=UPI0024167001|nr:PIG-L family deacetylase [Micromonospora sp. WMMD1082]MDG4793683.1 PIG-L family deacetylase [Micromonospora sp. WMMD1082]
MVLSPHLDDAVLSCGALIAALDSVIVTTVFNGRPVPPITESAARFHARCGHTDNNAMTEREKEDDRALSLVGASKTRLGLPEALYRKDQYGAPLYDSDTAIFVDSISESGQELTMVLDAVHKCVEAADPDLVLAPLGIGGHVDHLLVSMAARRLDRRVLYYEDVPYVLYDRCKGWEDDFQGQHAYLYPSTSDSWSAKTRAIEEYASQQQVLWYEPDAWREQLGAYARSIGCGHYAERLWSLDGQ